jgi:dTDP-4-amino-4,6-dideoxygalactose transaminase
MTETLALFGGDPVTRDPFPSWPHLSEKSIEAVVETLGAGRLTYWAGPRGRELEAGWAEWTGASHAVSCSSGSAALHLALEALGIGPGDEVIVPSHSFISTAFSVMQARAVPVFADVSDDHTVDPRAIEALVTEKTKAVIVVHLFGAICDMDPINRIAQAHALRVIEDCAQSVGGEYRGRKAGTLGDAGCFSFSQNKHLTTGGEGGMVVSGDAALARELRSLRDHGYDAEAWRAIKPGTEQPPAAHLRMGYNYRMTEMQSAIGLGELPRLDEWNINRRRGFARVYDHAFGQAAGIARLPLSTEERRNAYWQYPIQLDLERLTCGTPRFIEALSAEGIPCAPVRWRQSYEEPAFAPYTGTRCPNAEKISARTAVLYLHPTWEKKHIELCAAGVKKALRAFKR